MIHKICDYCETVEYCAVFSCVQIKALTPHKGPNKNAYAEPTVEDSIKQLVRALVMSKGWMTSYADSIVRDAIERKFVGSAVMLPMEFEDGRRGYFIDTPEFYCDIEPDAETGTWSVFFRDQKDGTEVFGVNQAKSPIARDSLIKQWHAGAGGHLSYAMFEELVRWTETQHNIKE